jgi:YaiO family outer membrane protein
MEQIRSKRAADRLARGATMSCRLLLLACAVMANVGGADRALAQNGAAVDVDSMVERANALRRTNRRARALDEIRRAAVLEPQRADVTQLHLLLQHEVHGSEAGAGVDYLTWSDRRPLWREHNLTVRKNTLRGPGIARVSRLARFGSIDQKIDVELYPAFPGGYGVVAFGASAGELYPRTMLSAELYRMLLARLEGSLGYRRLNFTNPVDLSTASLGRYVSDYLLGARAYHASGGATGTTVSLSARRYLADDGRYVGAHASAGSIREDLTRASDADLRSSRSIGAEAHFIVRSRWLITARQSLGRDQLRAGGSATFHSTQLQLGARF